MSKGEGIYVWDDDGKTVHRGSWPGLWCTGLGFSQQRLVDAATRQLQAMPYTHTFAHRSSMPVIELSEKLIGLAPEGISKAFFVNSGSEAVDAAIKFVWYYNNALDRPEKKKIIGRKRAYHGITIAGGHLTALAFARNGFDLPIERFLYAETPCHYRNAREGESEDDFSTRLAAELDQMIQDEGPETVAAFVAEPVMGAGGVMIPAGGLLRESPGRAEKARRLDGGRRGDLRLRADRQHVGLRYLQHSPRHHDLRQAAFLGLSADRGGA